MKFSKYLLPFLLAVLIVISVQPAAGAQGIEADADILIEEESPQLTQPKAETQADNVLDSGICGDNMTWQLTEDYTLTISGSGAMWEYYIYSHPWYEYRYYVRNVVVSNGVTSLSDYCFAHCNISSVSLPSSLTSLGAGCFYWSNVTDISLPSSLTSIGDSCFEQSWLESINLPSGITRLGDNVFLDCYLKSVTIPASVTRIGVRCFDECEYLNSITFLGNAPLIGLSCFGDVTATVYYPKDNATYTDAVKQNYGGKLTWIAKASGRPTTPTLSSVAHSANGITIKWKSASGAEKYKVQYMLSGGSYKTATTTSDTSYTIPADKFNSGSKYYFRVCSVGSDGTTSSYSTAKNLTYLTTPTVTDVSNTTSGVKVTWGSVKGAVNYCVMYKTASGSWKSAGTTTKNSFTVTGLTNGTKYYFTVRCVNSDNSKVTSAYNTTGKAITYRKQYKITFNANGGSNAPSTQTKSYGKTLTLTTAVPTRKGYTFLGWATSKTGDVKYKAGGSYTANSAQTLYAKWKPYTVTYNANGGSNAPSSQTKTYDKALTLRSGVPTRKGYDFSGWATSASGSVKYQPGDRFTTNGSVTLYAKWTPHKYTIKFNGNGKDSGTMSSLTGRKYGISYTLPANGYTKTGYQFVGWNTKADGTGTAYADQASVKNLTSKNGGSVTLYAQWKLKTFKITYKANGGSNAPSVQTKTYGKALSLRTGIPTRTGYTFQGWATSASGDVKYQPGNKYTANAAKTLYAKWTPHKYTIKFNGNGKDSGTMSALTGRKYGTSYTLPANGYTKTGCQFVGWNTKADGTGTAYANQASVKNLTSKDGGSVTLYAQWKLKTYKVTYNANGGDNAPSEQTKTYGKALSLRTGIPTRTGYRFLGWATSASGDVKYQSGGRYTANAAKTLYAKWTPHRYAITFDGNGEDYGIMPALNDWKYGTSYTLPVNSYTKSDYSFTGWNTRADGSGTSYADQETVMNLTSMDGDTVTLYAQWKQDSFDVYFYSDGVLVNTKRVSSNESIGTLPTISKSGYTFLGWYTDPTYGVKISSNMTVLESRSFYAHWQKDSSSGTGGSGGSSITPPSNPVKSRCNLCGGDGRCNRCGGTGKDGPIACPSCYSGGRCKACKGTGYL